MSADEHDRLAGLYGPLTDAVRELIDATIRTEADQDAIDRRADRDPGGDGRAAQQAA